MSACIRILLSTILSVVALHAAAVPVVNDNPEAEALFRQGFELLKLASPLDLATDSIEILDVAWDAGHYKKGGQYAAKVEEGWRLVEQAADKGSLRGIFCMNYGPNNWRFKNAIDIAAKAGYPKALFFQAKPYEGDNRHMGIPTKSEAQLMLGEAGADGDTDAMWGWCASYNDGKFPPGQEATIQARCKAWGNSSQHKSIPDYFDRCLTHDPEIHCSEETRRIYRRLKDNIKVWEHLILDAAEAGDPEAREQWCEYKRKTNDPSPGLEDKCGLWDEQSAARGNRRAWSPYLRENDLKIARLQQDAYADGREIVFVGHKISPDKRSARTDRKAVQPDDCIMLHDYFRSWFELQACASPRPGYPKWWGLGKDFTAPPASAAAEKLYQEGLSRLVNQDIKGAAALLGKAVQAGHTGAMINLALAYLEFPNILLGSPDANALDAKKPAWQSVMKADTKGDSRAHYMLSYFSYEGVYPSPTELRKGITKTYVERNRLDAERYERESAERGLARAQYVLGWRLIREEQQKEGWDWLKKAYDNGERIAGFDLYRIARYVQKDNAQALQYLRSTATDGELASADLLAEIYDKGLLGETKNATRAACYRAAVTAHKDMTWEQRLDLRLPELGRCQ
jgi:TPR repeat protein